MYTAFIVRQQSFVLPCFNTSWESSHRLPISRLHFQSLHSRRPWKIECFPSKKTSHVCLSFSKIKIVSLQGNIQAGSLPIIKDLGSLSAGFPCCNNLLQVQTSPVPHCVPCGNWGKGSWGNTILWLLLMLWIIVLCLWPKSLLFSANIHDTGRINY